MRGRTIGKAITAQEQGERSPKETLQALQQ